MNLMDDQTLDLLSEPFEDLNIRELKDRIKRLDEFRVGLLARAKFKEDEKVIVVQLPEISEKVNYGWLGRTVLHIGALGSVVRIDFARGEFIYGVLFEGDKHIFWLKEEYLK